MKSILLIVDPQNDFITGSLAVEGAKERMMKLASYIEQHNYDYVYITLDSHPQDHCSFKDNGGIWPIHCVTETNGWKIPEYLEKSLIDIYSPYVLKGTHSNKEEYSIFDNCEDGTMLTNQITTLFRENAVYIDICGIAGDYCVLETLKGLRKIIGDKYITILTQYTASIDGGKKLMNYIKENDLNYE